MKSEKFAIHYIYHFNSDSIFRQQYFLAGPVLAKVVHFQIKGHGNPQDDATPTFFPDSKSSTLALLKSMSYVSELFWEGGESQQNFFSLY